MRSALIVLLATVSTADAQRTSFGWLGGTEVVAAGTAELEVRVAERDDVGDVHLRESSLWSGARVGLSDRVELTLPVELAWRSAVGVDPQLALRRYGAEL